MMDPNILDIDFTVLNQIENILENKSTRETFLKAVPPEYFSYDDIQLMDNESYKYHMTTARWLLYRLGSKEVRVSDFVRWLENANLEKILILLKKDVAIQITKQPPSAVQVQLGAKLFVSCKASAYPKPDYQWYKGDEELLLQQESELCIPAVKEDDMGTYYCLVSKTNLEDGNISFMYSNPVEVLILKESFKRPGCFENCGLVSESNFSLFSSEDNFTSIDCNRLQQDSTCNVPTITIVKQPFITGKIPQGISVNLYCEAESMYPVTYQWYKNGRPVVGATACELHLKELYPDPDTGDMKWQYLCEVSNECEKVFSRTAVVKLDNANSSTVYYASSKYAFMIANDTYEHLAALKTPSNDVTDLGKLLESMDFRVFAYKNLTLTEMKNAFSRFLKELKPDCYILFYFAGHGFEQYGQMYLQPVDSSYNYIPTESICTEYILECMQAARPSLNILLIDACRKPPPKFLDISNPALPGEIYLEAKMKNNTLYGFSTPFLYASHECDSQRNSFFVKYLKKYITYNQSIQEVLMHVQRDFEGDPLIKGVQFPVIKSSLCAHRKLCDELQRNTNLSNFGINYLDDIRRDIGEFEIPRIKSTITLEMTPHLDVFINGIDISVYLFIEPSTPIGILKDLEINLEFRLPEIQVLPLTGIHLENLELVSSTKNMLFKKHLIGIQKLKSSSLNGKLLLKFTKLKMHLEKEFPINVDNIIDMKLSTNNLN